MRRVEERRDSRVRVCWWLCVGHTAHSSRVFSPKEEQVDRPAVTDTPEQLVGSAACLKLLCRLVPLTSSKLSLKPSKSNLRTQIEKAGLFIAM